MYTDDGKLPKERRGRMKTLLDKETYIKLAKAYSNQEIYEDKVRESIKAIAGEQGAYVGLIGLPVSTSLIMDAVLDVLGEEFSFFFYDCDRNLKEYNSIMTLDDGSHPDVKDFGDLWEIEQATWEG